jgi:hypothetical protein
MTVKTDDQSNGQNEGGNEGTQTTPSAPQGLDLNDPAIKEFINSQVTEALKPIKGNLDKAYEARDNALQKAKLLEDEKRAAELKKLEEDGKFQELYELKLAEERAAKEVLAKRNVELSRDLEVRNILTTLPFRNENAQEMAYREIAGQLVQNDKGVWVHSSGVPVRDFVKQFQANEANEFLFKAKTSSGTGTTQNRGTSTGKKVASIFQMSQEEVLKRIAEGTLQDHLDKG